MAASLAPITTAAHPLDTAAQPSDIATMSFEDALGELERIVKGLESGSQKLEEAISAYERGALLRRHCEEKLREVESRIAAIVETPSGQTLRDLA